MSFRKQEEQLTEAEIEILTKQKNQLIEEITKAKDSFLRIKRSYRLGI